MVKRVFGCLLIILWSFGTLSALWKGQEGKPLLQNKDDKEMCSPASGMVDVPLGESEYYQSSKISNSDEDGKVNCFALFEELMRNGFDSTICQEYGQKVVALTFLFAGAFVCCMLLIVGGVVVISIV